MKNHFMFTICTALGFIADGGTVANVSVESNLNNNVSYDTQTVVFTCTIRDNGQSPIILAWKSKNYVGPGGDVLEVASIDNPGTTKYSSTHPTTMATFISTIVINDTGVTVTEIVSELRITASIEYPNSSISCQLDNHGTPVTFEFRVIQPIILLTSNLSKEMIAYDNQTVVFTCVIQGPGILILSWISDDYIGQSNVIEFASIDAPERTPRIPSTFDPATVATLISTTTNNDTGVTEIVSELCITASTQYSFSSVGCRIDGHGVINYTAFQTLNATANTQTTSTKTVTTLDETSFPSDPATSTEPGQNPGQTIIAAVVSIGVFSAVLIILILLCCSITKRSKRSISPYHRTPESVTRHHANTNTSLNSLKESSIPPTGESQ